MSNNGNADGASALAVGRDLIRNAAKWFIAGLGAIGAVLVAGSQVSSLGALDLDSSRLWIAVGGMVVGLAAVIYAMSAVVDVLAGRAWTWDDVVRASEDKGRGRGRRGSSPSEVGTWLTDNPSALGGYATISEIDSEFNQAQAGEENLGELADLMTQVTDQIASVDLDSRWMRLRSQIGAGVAVGALGIMVFAWAANPSKADVTPPALRAAKLTGADLRGASLRNADLTGADLTRVNLQNADLRGARVDMVTWKDTTCPDGTNSDTIPPGTTPTCVGHLAP